jgi:membrane-associated phospholipid phosphatase
MIVALTLGTALTNLLKAFWHEPRPYLLSSAIIPAKCKAVEYGMPSGHTMGFMIVYRTFVKMLNQHFVLEVLVFAGCLLVGYNRAQMQLHSFD